MGRLRARCKLGFNLTTRSITAVMNLALLGLPSIARSSYTSAHYAVTRTRRWMSLSAKASGSTLVLASSTPVLPSETNRLESLRRVLPFPARLRSRRYRHRLSMVQRLIHLSTHPEPVKQHRQLPGHRYRRSLLPILPATLAEPQPIPS